MEIVLTKNLDETINILFPPNFSNIAPGIYKFKYDSELFASSKENVVISSKESEVTSPKKNEVTSPKENEVTSPKENVIISSKESEVISSKESEVLIPEIVQVFSIPVKLTDENYYHLYIKIEEYLNIFEKSIVDKIKLNKNLLNIWNHELSRSVFIYLMKQIFSHRFEEESFKMMSIEVRAYLEFLFNSHSTNYNWCRTHNMWSEYQIKLNKILDNSSINKEVINSFKIIFNDLGILCI